MTRCRLLALASVILLAACRRVAEPGPPRPTSVEPPAGIAGSPQAITIRGEGFRLQVLQSVDHRETRVLGTYRAWLGGTELEAVEWVDPGTLRARVPAAVAPGLHELAVEGPFGRGVLAGGYRVVSGAAAVLAAAGTLSPATASTGQTVAVTLTVEHRGGPSIDLVPAMDVAGTATLVPTAAPDARRLDEGARAVLRWTYRAEAAGDAVLSPRVDAVDAASGAPFSAPPAVTPLRLAVRVERRSALEATLAVPAAIAAGEFAVTLTVVNRGDAAALAVAPAPLTSAPGTTATVSPVAAPAGPVDVAGGGAVATFEWTYMAAGPGLLRLSGSVSGTDANDGGASTAAATSNDGVVTVAPPPDVTVRVVASDPFGDGTTFAFVAPLGGDVYLGPSRTGTGLVRMSPEGAAPASLALSFARDTTGNLSRNVHPPLASIGFTGCARDASADACGPDDEDGRGLLAAVALDGREWLLLGGARAAGDLDYVYASPGGPPPLAFSYVDLSVLLGGGTRSFTAALSSGGRLYLGFSDTGGSRPYGISLGTAPAAPGLDARDKADALDLKVDDAFRVAVATFPQLTLLDLFAEHEGRVYAFSSVGCIASRTSTPAGPADFAGCTPAASAGYGAAASLAPARAADLLPRDRTWPQAASWNGRLYTIRNTTGGPQLWACAPAGGADPGACEPGDWVLVAADPAGFTRLGHPGADAATLLVATPTGLYVGLDDPTAGLHVHRTSAPVPASISDFTGRDGCIAGSVGCAGLGGDGFGEPAVLTRILDAKAVTGTDGRRGLVLTAGDGVAPVRVIRVAE